MNSIDTKRVYIIGIAAALALQCLPGPGNLAQAQIPLPGPVDDLTRIDDDLLRERRLQRQLEAAADDIDATTRDVVDQADGVLGDAVDTVGETVETADGLLRNFVGGVDPDGREIEAEIIVVLVDTADADSLEQTATEVVSRRDLPALGQSMLVLRRIVNLPLPDAIEALREANPGATVDYNHLYQQTAVTTTTVGTETPGESVPVAAVDHGALRIGVIDSAVMREHFALQKVHIVDRDFAVNAGTRPLTHGTAIASLVAKSSADNAAIHAASVFFQLPNRGPGATTESIVAALDWLVSENVAVINMSLAGPGNQLLEAAIAGVLEKGVSIVAAVGNNGPSGEPLYPAAYENVIGVTAVDRKNKVFRYANRGEQVDYAALGVDIKVADSTTGGWRIESGTSMASPHVAVVVAQTLRAASVDSDALMSWLIANAEDLGRRGFDKTYGYGLITHPPVVVSAN